MNNNLSVLIVDKDTASRETIAKILSQDIQVHRVLQAKSGTEALKVIANEPKLEWVISELELDDFSYFDFVTELRKFPSAKDTTLIVVANEAHRDALVSAAIAGAVDFFTKPLRPATLLLKFRNLISRQYQRGSERLAVVESLNSEIVFEGAATYKGRLLDISNGGCQIVADPFGNGGSVLDAATLTINTGTESFSVKSSLVRLERCFADKVKVRAAFQFTDMTAEIESKIAAFIEMLNQDTA